MTIRLARGLPASVLGLALVAVLAGALPRSEAGPASPPAPDKDALVAHVAALAGPAMNGRGSPEDREKAAAHVEKALREAGVKDVPGRTGFRCPFPASASRPAGVNLAGWVAGEKADEYVIVSAHYDHLGKKADGTYFGADDNATGVAALVEVARALAAGEKPVRSVMVAAFDLEETQDMGSAAFAKAPPLPLERCAAFVTADMLGRSLADLFPGLLLVMGGERADGLAEAVKGVSPEVGITVREMGMDFNSLGWSDYVAFEERKVPCLFLTSGACRDYHRPEDVPEKVDAAALHARTRWMLGLVRALCGLPARPVWKTTPDPRLVEIETIHALVKGFGEQEAALGVPPMVAAMRKAFEDNLAATLARGKVDAKERAAIRNQALMLFRMASQLR
jgi:hypothetical protein